MLTRSGSSSGKHPENGDATNQPLNNPPDEPSCARRTNTRRRSQTSPEYVEHRSLRTADTALHRSPENAPAQRAPLSVMQRPRRAQQPLLPTSQIPSEFSFIKMMTLLTALPLTRNRGACTPAKTSDDLSGGYIPTSCRHPGGRENIHKPRAESSSISNAETQTCSTAPSPNFPNTLGN